MIIARALARSFLLNVIAAGTGLGATLFITWSFGLAAFAYYAINSAKLALILLGAELLPSSFTIFRLQEDSRFVEAVPVFYLAFAICAALAAGTLIDFGLVNHSSWFMVLFVFSSALQRYFDAQAQAGGRVDAYFWIPATTNIARLGLLVGLSLLHVSSVDDILWVASAVGGLIGQAVMVSRFPEFINFEAYRRPLSKLAYLWSLRRAFYEYYPNSVLKRLRDTFLPLFSDLAMGSKVEVGRLLVFTRANEAICAQVRILEAFMVNRETRENLRDARRRIFVTVGPLGQLGVAVTALALIYRHGIGPTDVGLALLTGLFIYPYILELYWRNDALASFAPGRVTLSLVAFLAALAIPPAIAWAIGRLSIALVLLSYVLGQSLAAATYRLRPLPGRTTAGGQPG